MLYIITLILKIIGILLLSILGLLILLIGILIFVPIHYKMNGAYQEKGILQCQVHWLLRIIHCRINIDSKASPIIWYRFRILWFTVSGTDKKQRETKPRKNKKKKKSKKKENQIRISKPETADKIEPIKSVQLEQPIELIQEVSPDRMIPDDKEKIIRTEKPPSFMERFMKIWNKLIAWLKSVILRIKNIKYTIEKMYDKIEKWQETYDYYRNMYERKETKETFKLCKKQLMYIGRKLKPQKFLCHISFGLDDSSLTGQILAICGMLYPIIGNNVLVQADFERVFFEGDIYIKGKIRIYTLIRVLIVVYFNRNVKALLKLLKREEMKDGRK